MLCRGGDFQIDRSSLFMKCSESTRRGFRRRRMAGLPGGGMLLAGMVAAAAHGMTTVSPDEMAGKTQWLQEHLLGAARLPPFSFTYGGQPSSSLLPTWSRGEADTVL